MKGDFSKWEFNAFDNFTGVLYQQGRAGLEQDGNADTLIASYLRQLMGRDTIGPHVAAVPFEAGDSFKVLKAQADSSSVSLTLIPGRVWVDGLALQVEGTGSYTRPADYLVPPIQEPQVDPASIGSGTRDAVVLEVWEEAFNGFQDPTHLIEAALGGVDTTERVKLFHNLRLYRLAPEDDCDNLADKLADNFSTKGKLTATPAPTLSIAGDCPVEAGGGYTGFEHYLYRIEIAEPDAAGNARFKWSRFGGGLVGRGTYDSGEATITILANDQMINHCGLKRFYLEALQPEPNGDRWKVVFSANASLVADSKLALTNVHGTWPSGGSGTSPPVNGKAFFRLWDGIRLISDYPTGKPTPNELENGLRLEFDMPAAGNTNYTPGDYWTVPVRTAGVEFDPSVWPTNATPQGVHYHRAPLAILEWNKAPATTITSPNQIHDCRHKFPPLAEISLGCCIDVQPGEDIHRALKKVIQAGGGCICLLPGNHLLRKTIDLSNRSDVHFKGFGSVSRLYISTQLKGSAPFILSGSKDISFDSFVIFNRTANTVWSCERTKNLTIKNMIASTTLVKGTQKIISITGNQCHQWRLENNVFSGPVAIGGTLLSNSSICYNVFQGAYRGIDLRYIQRSKIEGNRFSSLHKNFLAKHEFKIEDLIKKDDIRKRHFANMTLRPFLPTKKLEIAPDYSGIDVSGVFETDIIDNHFEGRVGLDCELVENAKIHSNDFITTVMGASCGLVHSLRFSENRIGLKSDGQNKEKDVQCRLGLAILADAVNCQILNNSFANVQEGIVFESDLDGKKAISRDFSVNLLAMKSVTKDMAKRAMADSKARIKERLDKQLLLNSTYFRIGKCEHTLIQGNQFIASQTAIEWSGTKNIVDFRIVNNSFIGCQDVAIQIEPDDRIFFMADPVDTKVRLVEKNRFEVYSGAVRATIGAVRIEKNDIRIKAPPMIFVPQINFMLAAAENVYKLAPFTEAVKTNDTPMMRMAVTEATNSVEKNPGGINKSGYSKTLDNTILKKYAPKKGDVLADASFVMKTFADIGEINFIAPLLNAQIIKLQVSTEGFAVNLSGIQNRAVHNRIYSSNTQRPGGVVFHVVSGEVRDNEVSVPGTALLLNGKLGVSAAYRGVEIVGNSLIAAGIPGEKKAVYALAIPSLSAGNISVTNNQFKGSVMVGGDPISAQGFTKKEKFEVLDKVIFYNVIKYDMPTYTMATVTKAFPIQTGTFGQFTPPIIVIPAWLLDPHADRPVVQFSNNRVIQGWVGIFQTLSGAYWSQSLLEKQGNKALVANLNGNVIDYGGSIVGYDVIMVGNQSQLALKYRAGRKSETVANIPEAQSF